MKVMKRSIPLGGGMLLGGGMAPPRLPDGRLLDVSDPTTCPTMLTLPLVVVDPVPETVLLETSDAYDWEAWAGA